MDYIIDLNIDGDLARNILKNDPPPSIKREVSDWLDENCDDWHFCGGVALPGEYNEGLKFTFESKSDIVAFKLRWS